MPTPNDRLLHLERAEGPPPTPDPLSLALLQLLRLRPDAGRLLSVAEAANADGRLPHDRLALAVAKAMAALSEATAAGLYDSAPGEELRQLVERWYALEVARCTDERN